MPRSTPPALRILNWGLGQDSTTIALLAEHGEIPPFDAIIWADTQQEPAEVYETMAWVVPRLTPPVYRVTAGDLGAHVLDNERAAARHWSHPPFYIREGATPKGPLRRTCTQDFKVIPIRRKIRELLGVKPHGGIPKGVWVDQAIGFPLDELGRTFCSDVRWIVNTFPLIDQRMRKHDCARWLIAHGYAVPPKSSCTWCPYHSNAYWRRMRDTQPAEWQRAVDFEANVQRMKSTRVRGTPYLHRSMVPLPMAPIDAPETGQEELFCFACAT
jgi:hypothetical protein